MSQIFLGYPPPKIREFIIEHYGPTDMTKVPLHFVAEEAGAKMSFSIVKGTYQTSTDGKNWTDYNSDTEITLANVGDKVYFKAKTANDSCFDFNMDVGSQFLINQGKIAAKGNIQSLLDETCQRMDVPRSCYFCMFVGCEFLTQAPELPATTLADACYADMFSGCTALKTASFPNLDKETVTSDIVESQNPFMDAASNIQATCQDGILVINSTEA